MLEFEIATPEKIVYKDNIDQISLPTIMGEITILPHHRPLVAALAPGEIRIIKNNTEKLLAVGEGFVQVKPNNRVIVLAQNAETAEEIDYERAEAAKKRASELMKQKNFEDVEYATLAAKIERELARLRVAKKHRSHHRP